MRSFIINADDCGMSVYVNACIEEGINLGKISSTTIIANMHDFDGAIRLYKSYGDRVSFGWHINLDEGEPLTRSQLLLDKGFFIEHDDKLLLNGGAFRHAFFNKEMREAIKIELRKQWEKIKDSGVDITHADGHHYIHSQPSMVQIIPFLFDELGIDRCRHVANYGIKGISGIARSTWAFYFKTKGIRMPDTFCAFSDYYNHPNLSQGSTIELMCHPGHHSEEYKIEFELVKTIDVRNWGGDLISYKSI